MTEPISPQRLDEIDAICDARDCSDDEHRAIRELRAEVDRLTAKDTQDLRTATQASAQLQAALSRHAGWQLEYDIALVVADRKRLLDRVAQLEAEPEHPAPITDVDAIEALPVGTVLFEQISQHPGQAMAWRKERDGYWYPSTFSWVRQQGALAMAGSKPILIHLPPQPVHGSD